MQRYVPIPRETTATGTENQPNDARDTTAAVAENNAVGQPEVEAEAAVDDQHVEVHTSLPSPRQQGTQNPIVVDNNPLLGFIGQQYEPGPIPSNPINEDIGNSDEDDDSMPSLISDSQCSSPRHGAGPNQEGSPVQDNEHMAPSPVPPVVQKDLCILSKFWADGTDDLDPQGNPHEIAEALVESHFEEVITKSQKKRLRQKQKQMGKSAAVATRSRAGPRNYA